MYSLESRLAEAAFRHLILKVALPSVARYLTSDVQSLTSKAEKWVIGSLLIGSACIFLLWGIKIGAHRDPMKSTRAGTWKVEKDDPRDLSQDRCQKMG